MRSRQRCHIGRKRSDGLELYVTKVRMHASVCMQRVAVRADFGVGVVDAIVVSVIFVEYIKAARELW